MYAYEGVEIDESVSEVNVWSFDRDLRDFELVQPMTGEATWRSDGVVALCSEHTIVAVMMKSRVGQ